MAYTIEELKKMGAKPVAPTATVAGTGKKYTPEELQKIGAQPVAPAEEPKQDGFFKSLAKDIARPVVSLAARPVQLAKALGGASVEEQAVDLPFGLGKLETSTGVKDVVKDLGRGAEVASYAVGGGAAKAGLKGLIKEGAKQGAKSGALYGGGSATAEGKDVGEVIKETAIGGITGGVLGAAVPATLKSVNAVRNLRVERAAKAAKEFDNLAGKIVQGTPEDIAYAKKVLSEVDPKGIKSYADLGDALDDKIETISGKLDEVLDTDPYAKVLDEWKYKTKVGDVEIEHNFVDDALKQIDEYFTKIADVEGKARITQLREKAIREGLSTKEINDLARLHGRKLNAFNVNGELASGLTKVAAENTRKGLKRTARQQFNNPLYEGADTELTKIINVRDLVRDMETKVNKLQQKVMDRGLGERAGRLLGRVLDITSGGTLKGVFNYLIPRGEGLKVLNALDLEKQLAKNLKKLQEIADTDLPEEQIIAKLEQFLMDNGVPPEKPRPFKKK